MVSEEESILDSLKDYLPTDILENEQLKKYGTKGVAFLEQVDVTLPNDGEYIPPAYNGATKLAQGFHNIPRGGNTNDIVSLSRLPSKDYESLSADTAKADEYVRGIVVISIVMALIYILWGVFLLVLRLGRLGDCCACGQTFIAKFRAQGGCCIQRHLCGWMSGRTPQRPTKASLKRDQEIRANGIVQKSIDAITQTSATAAAAAVATTTTSLSGKKKDNSSIMKADDEIAPVRVEEDVSPPEDPQTNDDNNKQPTKQWDSTKAADDNKDAAGGRKENNNNDDDDDQTTNTEIISDEDLASLQQREERHMMAIRISFLFWGIIVIVACIMLSISGFGVAGRLVDSTQVSTTDKLSNCYSCTLTSPKNCHSSAKHPSLYLNIPQASLGRFENYLETIIGNCDDFLNRTAQARQAREQFLAKFDKSSGNQSSEENDKLCPNFPTGIATLEVNLGQLFEGPLLKLAEVRDPVTNETSVTVVSFLDDSFLGNALDLDFSRLKQLVQEKISQGKEIMTNSIATEGGDSTTTSSIVEVVTNAIPEGLVDQTVETVTDVVEDVLPEAGEAVQSITEAIPSLVNETAETISETLDDVIPEAGEAVQSITEAVPDLLNETLETVTEVLDDVIPEAGETLQSLTEVVPGVLNETVDTVTEMLDDVIPEPGEVVQAVTEATQDLVNQTVVQAVTNDGEVRRMQQQQDNEVVSVGGDAASFTIIGDPSAYKNNLSAVLATNFSIEVNFIEISERINKKLSSSSFQVLGDQIYTLRNGLQFVLDTLQDASNSMVSIV